MEAPKRTVTESRLHPFPIYAAVAADLGEPPPYGQPAHPLPSFTDGDPEAAREGDGPCCSNPDRSSPCPNHDTDFYDHDQMHADRETEQADAESGES